MSDAVATEAGSPALKAEVKPAYSSSTPENAPPNPQAKQAFNSAFPPPPPENANQIPDPQGKLAKLAGVPHPHISVPESDNKYLPGQSTDLRDYTQFDPNSVEVNFSYRASDGTLVPLSNAGSQEHRQQNNTSEFANPQEARSYQISMDLLEEEMNTNHKDFTQIQRENARQDLRRSFQKKPGVYQPLLVKPSEARNNGDIITPGETLGGRMATRYLDPSKAEDIEIIKSLDIERSLREAYNSSKKTHGEVSQFINAIADQYQSDDPNHDRNKALHRAVQELGRLAKFDVSGEHPLDQKLSKDVSIVELTKRITAISEGMRNKTIDPRLLSEKTGSYTDVGFGERTISGSDVRYIKKAFQRLEKSQGTSPETYQAAQIALKYINKQLGYTLTGDIAELAKIGIAGIVKLFSK